MKRTDFRFRDRLRVRWAEVDMQRIVFNGHYLTYLDTAVAGYWRALALPYATTMEHLGGDLFVRKATLEYEGSARYDDLLEVGIRCERIGKSSMVFAAGVFRDDTLLVHGELVYVFADPASQTSMPVPPELRALLEGYDAGEAMLDVRLGTWDALGREAAALRREVFVRELALPVALVEDAGDASAVQAVAFNRLGLAVGTARLLEREPGVAQLGRVAVVGSLRGAAVGHALVAALVNAARQRGDREVVLSARIVAERFFRAAGFEPRGASYVEAGVPHQDMVRAL